MRFLLVPAMLAAVVSCGTAAPESESAGEARLSPASGSPTAAATAPVSGEARATYRPTQGGTATPIFVRPGPSGTPVAPTAGKLTEQSSGRTVHVKRGDRVEVSLPGGSEGGYVPPATSDPHVVARTASSGGYPTDRPADALFVAVAAGSADLTSTTDFTCLHAHPSCLPPQRVWHVTVVVS